jgi:hypothetical protein
MRTDLPALALAKKPLTELCALCHEESIGMFWIAGGLMVRSTHVDVTSCCECRWLHLKNLDIALPDITLNLR